MLRSDAPDLCTERYEREPLAFWKRGLREQVPNSESASRTLGGVLRYEEYAGS